MSGTLPASACVRCGGVWVSPREACPWCGIPAAPSHAPGEGALLSFTTVHAAPEGLAPGYVLGLIALDGGPTVLCVAAPGTTSLAVGARVRVADAGGRLVFHAN